MCILWLTVGGFGAGHSLICGDRVQVWVLPVQWTDGSHLSDVKNVCVSIVHWCICQCVNLICAQFLCFSFFSFNHMHSNCLCFAAWFAFILIFFLSHFLNIFFINFCFLLSSLFF